MFNINDYKNRRETNLVFQERLELLKKEESELYQQKFCFDSTCTHDLILHFGKECYCGEDVGYAECLCCGKILKLKEYCDNEINPANIINLVGVVPDDYFHVGNAYGNVLATRAKEKLDLIAASGEDVPNDIIKKMIIEDLIAYTIEKNQERDAFVARIRKQENK